MTAPLEQHMTLHLCPKPVWDSQRSLDSYFPEGFESEGFIHCTDGDDRMVSVANQFYASDPRDFVVLTVDLTANGESWKYEDSEKVFPHIYGPIHPESVETVRRAVREPGGLFVAIE